MNDDFYKTTKYNISTDRNQRDLIDIRFFNGCSVSINGDENKEYSLIFFEDDTILYKSTIKSNHWSKTVKQYFGNYKVEIYCENKLIKSETLSLENKPVSIIIDSHSLGDSIAWIPQIDKFQKLHNCIVYVKCRWKELFEKSYPNLNFCEVYGECYASYTIGYFKEWNHRSPNDPRLTPLAKVASDILGLSYEEIKPKLLIEPVVSNKKYVCIATQSTSQCKYWNNENGWNDVVKYLNKLGYEVWCIDKHKDFGKLPNLNRMPVGSIDKTGDIPLSERMIQIAGAEFFIGLGSGLSWLAWSLNKPVVLISGFSKPFAEFDTPYRVFNENVCNGCWNDDSLRFDPSNWFWCPRNKNFECSKEISFEMVKDKIDKCLKDIKPNLNKEKYFDDYQIGWIYGKNKKDVFKNFDWGTCDKKFISAIVEETLNKKIYEKFFKVDENDIVVDFGSSIGPFIRSIIENNPKHIYAFEPSVDLFKILQKNITENNVTLLNCGISVTDGNSLGHVFNSTCDGDTPSMMKSISFKTFIKKYDIEKIDFLKTDCEGGEYCIFTEENLPWILKNVRKISGEWHLKGDFKERFRYFRDKILPNFKDYEVFSLDGVDIKWDLQNEHFINYYTEVMIYIKNDKCLEDKKK